MNERDSGAGGGSIEVESDEILRTSPNTIKRSSPTGEYAVRGAEIKCSFGNGLDVVNLPLCHGVYSGEHPLVSIKDMKVGENICSGFGVCITPEGEKFECIKEIKIDNEWINENKIRFHIDGEEVLATGALTMCSKHGGGIYVTKSGQDGKYVTQSTDEVELAKQRKLVKSFGEDTDIVNDLPELPAAILADLTTIEACEAKIKELGQMWHEADGNSALQEYYHRQANQIREHIISLGKTAPVSKEYLESVKRQLESTDGSDPLMISSDANPDLLGTEVKYLDELARKLDYGNGFIVIGEEKIPIYIPPYIDGSNDLVYDSCWEKYDFIKWNHTDVNIGKIIGSLGSNYEEESASVTVKLDKIIYLNGSKSGRIQELSSQSTRSTGFVAMALGFSELAASIRNSTTDYWITIRFQKNNTTKDKRAIIQIESTKNPMSIHAGNSYYHIDTSYLNEPSRVWVVKSLKDKLSKIGYEKYTSSDNLNIFNTVDIKHSNDLSHAYLGLDSNEKLLMYPKLFSDDRMEIVENTEAFYLSGVCTGHTSIYDLSSDLRTSVSLDEYGIEIIKRILDGRIQFVK